MISRYHMDITCGQFWGDQTHQIFGKDLRKGGGASRQGAWLFRNGLRLQRWGIPTSWHVQIHRQPYWWISGGTRSDSEDPSVGQPIQSAWRNRSEVSAWRTSGVFHSFTASLLFLSQRARRDIQTAVSFLTTRVKRPDEDDWLKLRRVLRYLKGTRRLKLRWRLTTWISHLVGWRITRSASRYARTHRSGVNLGRRSSYHIMYEAEDEHKKLYWDRNCGSAWRLAYDLVVGAFFTCTRIRRETHYLNSSKRTKHIEQRFFYITDQVEKGLVKIEHEYTDKMWIDVMTKPKQGMAFRVDRSKVMGCPIDYTEESI